MRFSAALGVIGLVLSNTSPALSQQWGLAQGNRDNILLADEETITEYAGRTLVWTALVPREPMDGMYYFVIRQSVDCRAGTMRYTAFSAFDAEGQPSLSDYSVGEERAAIPGSLDSGVLKVACEGDFITDLRFGTIDAAKRYFEPALDAVLATD